MIEGPTRWTVLGLLLVTAQLGCGQPGDPMGNPVDADAGSVDAGSMDAGRPPPPEDAGPPPPPEDAGSPEDQVAAMLELIETEVDPEYVYEFEGARFVPPEGKTLLIRHRRALAGARGLGRRAQADRPASSRRVEGHVERT
ncbi:MAG: hypothetical protein AAGH15_24005, partial [Myxococcota bacterium]